MKSNIYNRKVEFRTIADFVGIANVNTSTFTYMVNVRSGKRCNITWILIWLRVRYLCWVNDIQSISGNMNANHQTI